MLSMKDTGLVSGVELAKTPLVTVKALRGFFDEQGQTRKAGDVVLCSERFARALMTANKAELIPTGGIVTKPKTTVIVGESVSEQTVVQPEPDPVPEPEEEEDTEKRSKKRGRRHTRED